jgi:integrase
MLNKMVVSAGISVRVTPHILRHTYATQMAPIIGPEALQKQLGHEHLSTTLGTYYHQDPQLVGDTIRQGVNNFARTAAMMTEGL